VKLKDAISTPDKVIATQRRCYGELKLVLKATITPRNTSKYKLAAGLKTGRHCRLRDALCLFFKGKIYCAKQEEKAYKIPPLERLF